MNRHLLDCKNVSFSYHTLSGEISVIDHMSFHISEGEFVSIVGPSGCGKTTLLKLLTGLFQPESGSITLYYESAQESNRQSYYGYMPQQDQLFEWLTIKQNITLPLRLNHLFNADTDAYADNLLKQYGLAEYKDRKPSELSGGMRQRSALIRTLVMKPNLLYLDEPFSALDFQNRIKAADDIGQIIAKEKKTAILVTHDISEAISLSSRILILSKRPTTIIKEIALPYQEMHLNALKIRNMPDFQYYFNLVWKELEK